MLRTKMTVVSEQSTPPPTSSSSSTKGKQSAKATKANATKTTASKSNNTKGNENGNNGNSGCVVTYLCQPESPTNAPEVVVRFDQMKRAQPLPNLSQIKAKIREIAERDSVSNKIWLCNGDIVSEHGLSNELPANIAEVLGKRAANVQDFVPPAKKQKTQTTKSIQYPIPDEDIDRSGVKGSAPAPTPSNDFPVTPDTVATAIYVWDILVTFGTTILLSPMNLMTFLESLVCQDGTRNPVLDYSAFSLLCALVPKSHVQHTTHQSRQAQLAWKSRKPVKNYRESSSGSDSDSSSDKDSNDDSDDDTNASKSVSSSTTSKSKNNEFDLDIKDLTLTLLSWQPYLSALMARHTRTDWLEGVMSSLSKERFFLLDPMTKANILEWLCDQLLSSPVARRHMSLVIDERQEAARQHTKLQKDMARDDLGDATKVKAEDNFLREMLKYRGRLEPLGQDRFRRSFYYFVSCPQVLLIRDAENHWSYLASEREIDELIGWLDNRGIRERDLKAALTAHKSLISKGITTYAVSGSHVERRRSERLATQILPEYLMYENSYRT